MEIIIILALIVGGYILYTKYGKEEKKTVSPDHQLEPTIFDMKKGWTIDFYDNFILKGFPLKDFNILENGPYEVVDTNETTSTREYTLRGGSGDATLEVEKRGGRSVILIHTGLENFPSLLPELKKSWKEDIESFQFKEVTYYLTGNGEEEDDGEECYYWDYYSDAINEGNKLFLGVQDYGDEGSPDLEFYVGFEIPERSVKEIIPG